MSAAFALIQRFLREAAGLSFDDDKRYLVEDRLRPVMRGAGLSSLEELAARLHPARHGELGRAVVETLTINETSFFRDRALFTSFADSLLPRLIAARRDQRRLRLWCAGCSSGQEPYSLAMIIDEQTRRLGGWQVEILATDLSRPVVEVARRGLYSQFEVQRGLPVAMMLRYFHREGEGWRISDHLRARVSFQVLNLMMDFRALGPFDAIFCRNVLIYFDVETKRKVLAKLDGVLADDGFLALGAAEGVGGLCGGLRAVPEHRFAFEKSARPGARNLAMAGAGAHV